MPGAGSLPSNDTELKTCSHSSFLSLPARPIRVMAFPALAATPIRGFPATAIPAIARRAHGADAPIRVFPATATRAIARLVRGVDILIRVFPAADTLRRDFPATVTRIRASLVRADTRATRSPAEAVAVRCRSTIRDTRTIRFPGSAGHPDQGLPGGKKPLLWVVAYLAGQGWVWTPIEPPKPDQGLPPEEGEGTPEPK